MTKPTLETKVLPLESLLSSGTFRPAAVQREYQWGAEQCGVMLSDFERAWRASDLYMGAEVSGANVEQYYLGGFVVRVGEANDHEVFDGLQRLTSLTIFFSVARDLLFEINAPMSERLNTLVFKNPAIPRLKLGGGDQTLSNLVQARSEAIRSRRNLKANTLRARLLKAANVFQTHLSALSSEELVQFVTFIMERVKAAIIIVANERLARQIFITTNNRGLPLDEADVLKSQINSIPYRQDVASRVLGSWQHVAAGFEDKQDFQDFLYTIDFLTRRKGRSAEGLSQLGDFLGSQLDDQSVLEWFVDFEDLATAWHWLQSAKAAPGKDRILTVLAKLFVFDWDDWKPVALVLSQLYAEAKSNRDKRRLKTLQARFEALGRSCLALTLLDIGQAERNRLFAKALSDIKAGRNPSDHALKIDTAQRSQIEAALSAPVYDTALASQALRWIELNERSVLWPELCEATAYHVLPKHQSDHADWGVAFSDLETRWKQTHQWGNLVLLYGSGELFDEDATDFKHWKKQFGKDLPRSKTLSDAIRRSAWTDGVIAERSVRVREALRRDLLLVFP
ncbi:MAG: hypothetical protein Hens3KO_06290 [Henriciella sp.]